MIEKLDITLNIQNNKNYQQKVNLMGNPYDLLDTANAVTEYNWNLTGFSFTVETGITLQYKKAGASSFLTYTAGLPSKNVDGVVSALNGLGIGSFTSYTSAGSTYITTNNDAYVFGDLEITPSASLPTLIYIFDTTPYTGGNNIISVNAVPIVTEANPVSVSSFVPVVNNDTIDFNGTTPSAGSTTIYVYDITNSVYVYAPTILAPNTLFTYLFNVTYPNAYKISLVTT